MMWLEKATENPEIGSNTSTIGSGVDFLLDGKDKGRRDSFAMDAAADKLTEALLFGEHFTIFWIAFYFFEHFTFCVRGEFVIEEEIETGDKVLTVLIVFHRKMNL